MLVTTPDCSTLSMQSNDYLGKAHDELGPAPAMQGFELLMAMLLGPIQQGGMNTCAEGHDSRPDGEGYRAENGLSAQEATPLRAFVSRTTETVGHVPAAWERLAPMVVPSNQPLQPIGILDNETVRPCPMLRLLDSTLQEQAIESPSRQATPFPVPDTREPSLSSPNKSPNVTLLHRPLLDLAPANGMSKLNETIELMADTKLGSRAQHVASEVAICDQDCLESADTNRFVIARQYSRDGSAGAAGPDMMSPAPRSLDTRPAVLGEARPVAHVQAPAHKPVVEPLIGNTPVKQPLEARPYVPVPPLTSTEEPLANNIAAQESVHTRTQPSVSTKAPVVDPPTNVMPTITHESAVRDVLLGVSQEVQTAVLLGVSQEVQTAVPRGVSQEVQTAVAHEQAAREPLSGEKPAPGAQSVQIGFGSTMRAEASAAYRHDAAEASLVKGMTGGLGGQKFHGQGPPMAAPAGKSGAAPVQIQVVQKISIAPLKPGEVQRLTLDLEPEHLGRVQVQISAREDRLEIVMQADAPAAIRVLRGHIQDLTRALMGKIEGRWTHIDVRFVESGVLDQDGDDLGREQKDRPKDDQRRGDSSGRHDGQDGP